MFAEAKKDPDSFFTPYARKFVAEARRESQYYTAVVFRTDTDRAAGNVWRGDSSAPAERRLVDLIERTCSCGEWYDKGLPCRHAFALATEAEKHGYTLSLRAAEWLERGSDRAYRMPIWRQYFSSDDAAFISMCDNDNIEPVANRYPPLNKSFGKREKTTGRKRKNRIASTGEVGPAAAKRQMKKKSSGQLAEAQELTYEELARVQQAMEERFYTDGFFS
jgi:hypothetical protein